MWWDATRDITVRLQIIRAWLAGRVAPSVSQGSLSHVHHARHQLHQWFITWSTALPIATAHAQLVSTALMFNLNATSAIPIAIHVM